MKPYRQLLPLFIAIAMAATCLAANKPAQADPETDAFKAELTKVIKELETGSDASFMKALDRLGPVADAFDSIPESETGFRAAAAEAVGGVGRELVRKTNQCGRSRVVRMRRAGESLFTLVRFDYGDEGWGWTEFELAPGLDGGMRIVDVIDYSTGQSLVEAIRTEAASALVGEEAIAKLYSIPVDSPALDLMIELLDALRSGNYADGVQAFYRMDGKLRAQKEVAFLALRSAVLAGNPISYMKILKGLSEDRTADPTLSLFLADYHFMADEPARALALIEEFERRTGLRDGVLLAMKAQASCALGRADAGLAFARESIAAEPGIQDGHWAAFKCQVAARRFDLALDEAKILEDRFDYRLDDELLSKSDFYADFVASRVFRKWRGNTEEE